MSGPWPARPPATRPAFTALAEGLPPTVPFVGPERQERDRGRGFTARLGANESGFGPSPMAVEAMVAAAASMWRYGDSDAHALRAALAARFAVPEGAVLVGEGIDGLLGLTVRLFAGAGDAVVTSAGAYPTFNYHVAGFGARLVTVPFAADHEDLDGLADAARETGAKLVYLSNPDNPMGTWHPGAAIAAMLDRLPEGTLLCLDEAYAEFAPPEALPPIDIDDPRVIRFRTFSKAHGLAGLRIAYAIGTPEIIAGFHRIRNHFGVNRMGQEAALASLSDEGHIAWVRAEADASKARIAEAARAHGLAPLPSAANFIAIDCGAGGDFARAVLKGLIERDIFVRMPGVAPLDRCIRVSAGPEPETDRFAEALEPALEDARAALAPQASGAG